MTAINISAAGDRLRDPSPIAIREAAPRDLDRCEAYLRSSSKGNVFHRRGWHDAARDAYGYESHILIAERGAQLVGFLALTDVRSRLTGNAMISSAFAVGGGPVGDDDEIVAALAAAASELASRARSRYLELRCDAGLPSPWLNKSGIYASFAMALPPDEDETLRAIPRKRRAEVRKAIKAEGDGALVLRIDRDPERFYSLYARSLRDHGTPVYPKIFLETLAASFGEEVEFSFAEYQGKTVAGLCSFRDQACYYPYYIGALDTARTVRGAEFLYWKAMRRAANAGCTMFDFGRSKINSGPYHFKKLWGIEPEALTYQVRMFTGDELPDINPNNPKFAAAVAVWKKLPLPIANRLGPLVAGNFP